MSPGDVALVHDGKTYTYAAVRDQTFGAAAALRDAGIGPGDRVAYLGRNTTSLPVCLFAAGALGAVFVPLNTRLAAPELASILADCTPSVLVFDDAFASVAPSLGARAVPAASLCAAATGTALDVPVALEDICMIQYTSGTSGRPKGVRLSHGNIAWNCYNMLIDVDVTSDEVSLVSAPMFHTAALNQLFLPTFLKGGTAVLMTAFDPAGALGMIASHKVTWMFGVPAMFAAMTRSASWPDADLSSVRILMCGGAPVPEPLIRAYQERGLTFVQGYGLTETSPGALFLRARESVRKAGSAGTACFFTDVRVVSAGGADVAAGETGEVLISGPNVTPGYWGRQPLDGEAPWLASGDAATVDADGYVYIRGRQKDMFISGGENVYPAEVEQALLEHPAVAECAVIGVPDAIWGEVGRAVVVPGGPVSGPSLLAFLDGRIARYKIPKSVVFADGLPRNATGKLIKARLLDLFGDS
jgi:fatty-acyl-CoA synthase